MRRAAFVIVPVAIYLAAFAVFGLSGDTDQRVRVGRVTAKEHTPIRHFHKCVVVNTDPCGAKTLETTPEQWFIVITEMRPDPGRPARWTRWKVGQGTWDSVRIGQMWASE